MGFHELCIVSTILLVVCGLFIPQISSTDTLRQGDQLNSSSYLVSARKIFTLGFYTPRETNNSYVAIWYTDRDSYPVWIANRETLVFRNSTPSLSINSDGRLIIAHDGGNSTIEVSSGTSSKNVTCTLLDSGNLVLSNGSSSNSVFWQSFDYPTDTLLPGMKLGFNRRTGRKWGLTSWFGTNTPASGPFSLEWDANGSRFVISRRGVVYWTSGALKDYYGDYRGFKYHVKTFENFAMEPDPLNWNYNFSYFSSGEEEYVTYSLFQHPTDTMEERKVISGWRMRSNGDVAESDNLRLFPIVASLCYGYGSVDYKGCEAWVHPECRSRRQTFIFRSGGFMQSNGLRFSPTHVENSSLSLSDCREACWNDCKCFGFREANSGCIYWQGENLKFEQSLDGYAVQSYVIYPMSFDEGGKRRKWIIVSIVVPTVLIFFCATLFCLRRFVKGRIMDEEVKELLTLEGYNDTNELEHGGARGHDLKMFTYSSILAATDNLSPINKLGEGGFGPVYKGTSREGHSVAIKLLSRSSGQGLLEFKNELVLISKLQHVNLVKLIGFSIHGHDKVIVYEYMPNKSLDLILFDSLKRMQLDWGRRMAIIEGIAQGLLYLHKYSRLRIVHRDLKLSNILLDQNMTPKISDFGLARIFKQNISESNTDKRVGTYGYMAPEYAMQGIFSLKSDVYSFGVLVLEIVSGRKNNSFHQIEGPLNLVEHAWDLWSRNSALDLMDSALQGSCNGDQLHRCIHISLLCVEHHAADRPTIEDAISLLKNENASLPEPKNPSFISRNSVVELEKSTPVVFSTDEYSITQVEGR